MKKLLQLSFLPASADLALFLVRICFGPLMLGLHGWGKLMTFSDLMTKFPDPLGIGSPMSLTLAVTGEVLCSLLIVVGLFTRLAALGLGVTMGVAFFMVHERALIGENSGELALVYTCVCAVLFVGGGGAFALDGRLQGSGQSKVSPAKKK